VCAFSALQKIAKIPYCTRPRTVPDHATLFAFLGEKVCKEYARRTFLFCLMHAHSDFYNRTGDPCGASRRIIMEFAGLFPDWIRFPHTVSEPNSMVI
jgi:hypothetical protein